MYSCIAHYLLTFVSLYTVIFEYFSVRGVLYYKNFSMLWVDLSRFVAWFEALNYCPFSKQIFCLLEHNFESFCSRRYPTAKDFIFAFIYDTFFEKSVLSVQNFVCFSVTIFNTVICFHSNFESTIHSQHANGKNVYFMHIFMCHCFR